LTGSQNAFGVCQVFTIFGHTPFSVPVK